MRSPFRCTTRLSSRWMGVLAHAWDLDTVNKLLAPQCWVERLDEATSRKEDMSTFKVTAWTLNPASIPAAKKLLIAEAELPVVHSDPVNQRIFANVTPYLRVNQTEIEMMQ